MKEHGQRLSVGVRRFTTVLNTYSVGVQTQRQIVDYTLRRRTLLNDVYSGRTSSMDACDATPQLLSAAKFHGRSSNTPCPMCRNRRLTHVCWVYGDELKHAAGSAREPDELERMANLFTEFTVYVVEVCRLCAWNHLIRSYVLGTGTPTRSHRTAEP